MNATAAIAPYTSDDYEGAWALHQKTVRDNAGFVKNLSFHVDLHHIPSVYEAYFIMRDGGQVIGMVGLKRISEDAMEVKRLQVDADHHGKGYGRQLMDSAIVYAKAHGAKTLLLDVSEPQKSARALYLSLGFRITDVRKTVYGPDREEFLSTFMEKTL